jgi:hypothetical protein
MKTLYQNVTGITIAKLDTAGEVAELVNLFQLLADELGWRPGDQLHAYPRTSVYFAAMVGQELAGGLQLVVANGADPLPSRHVWPEIDLSSRTDVAHASIMALKQEYRGFPGLFTALTVEMWRHCATSGITEIWHEATTPTLRLYQRLGWPLEIVGPLRLHWGEDCYLCKMTVVAVAGNMVIKALQSPTHRETLATAVRPCAPIPAVMLTPIRTRDVEVPGMLPTALTAVAA